MHAQTLRLSTYTVAHYHDNLFLFYVNAWVGSAKLHVCSYRFDHAIEDSEASSKFVCHHLVQYILYFHGAINQNAMPTRPNPAPMP